MGPLPAACSCLLAAPSAATWPSTIRATARPLHHAGATPMVMEVHAAALPISAEAVATGVVATAAEAAMMMGMAMAAEAVAGGPLQHPSLLPCNPTRSGILLV